MRFKAGECKKGDIIRVHCGSIYHYGIYINDDEVIQFGPTPIAQLVKDQDKRIITSSIEQFSCGLIVETAILNLKEKLKRNSVNKTIQIARGMLGQGNYNIIHNNCEHFVNYCVFNIKYSYQEQQARNKWNNRDYLDVFISKVDYQKEIVTTNCKIRDKQIENTRDLTLKQQRYCLFDLLEKATMFSRKYSIMDLNLKLSKEGKYISDKCKLSFSHNKEYLFIALSNKQVGVDCESLIQRDGFDLATIWPKVKASDEVIDDYQSFIKIWTIKEAAFKYGRTKRFNPREINSNDYMKKTYQFIIDEHVFTIVSENLKPIRIYLYQNNEFIRSNYVNGIEG